MTETDEKTEEWRKQRALWTSLSRLTFRICLPLLVTGIGVGYLIGILVPNILCSDLLEVLWIHHSLDHVVEALCLERS